MKTYQIVSSGLAWVVYSSHYYLPKFEPIVRREEAEGLAEKLNLIYQAGYQKAQEDMRSALGIPEQQE